MAYLSVPMDKGEFNVEIKNKDLMDVAKSFGTSDIDKIDIKSDDVEIEKSVSNIIKPFYGAFISTPTSPEEISIEFGVKIGVKSGKITALLVEGGGEVQVTVKAVWRKN